MDKVARFFTSIELKIFFIACLIQAISVFTVWHPQENWYLEWASYVSKGQFPYKDFYLPFPPLFVFMFVPFIGYFKSLIFVHLFYLVIYALFVVGFYKLILDISTKKIALAISGTLSLYWAIHPTDNISGYYETATAFLVWGAYFYRKNGLFVSTFGALLISLSSLIKQNFIMVSITLLFTLIIALINQSKNQAVDSKSFILRFKLFGLIVPYALFLLYLIHIDALKEFISDMLVAGGKETSISRWLFNTIANFLSPAQLKTNLVVLSVGIISYLILENISKRKESREWRNWKHFLHSVLLSVPISLFILIILQRTSTWNYNTRFIVALSVGFFISTLLLLDTLERKHVDKDVSLFTLLSPVVVVYIVFTVREFETLSPLRKNLDPGQTLTNLALFLWSNWGSFIWFIFVVMLPLLLFQEKRDWYGFKSFRYNGKVRKEGSNYIPTKANTGDNSLLIFIIGIGLSDLLNAYNGGMFTDSSLVLVGIVIARFAYRNSNRITTALFTKLLTPLLIFSSSVMILIPYQWYYWNEFKSPTKTNNLELFKHFRLTGDQTEIYSNIKSSIDEIKNRRKDLETIVSLPAQPTISWLGSGYAGTNYFVNCPILWIDVCPEQEAKATVKKLLKDPVDILIYFRLENDTAIALSRIFRGSENSVVFELPQLLRSSGQYRLMDTLTSNSLGKNVVEIWVKN